jgi:hypothetical protein
MRFIIIDVEKCEVREHEWMSKDGNFLKFAYETIGNGCHVVEVVRISDIHDLWIDEEGQLKNPKKFFLWRMPSGEQQLLAGSAILAEHNYEGDTLGTRLKLEDVKRHVTFYINP